MKRQVLLSMPNQLCLPDFQSLVTSSVPNLYKNAASSMRGVLRTSPGPGAHVKQEKNTHGGSRPRKELIISLLMSLLGSLLIAQGLARTASPTDELFCCSSWRRSAGMPYRRRKAEPQHGSRLLPEEFGGCSMEEDEKSHPTHPGRMHRHPVLSKQPSFPHQGCSVSLVV